MMVAGQNPLNSTVDYNLFVSRYGCGGCPYRGLEKKPGVLGCPHKIGRSDVHPEGICTERLNEIYTLGTVFGTLDKVKLARRMSLIDIQQDLTRLRLRYQQLLEDPRFDEIVTSTDGHSRFNEIIGQLQQAQSKYHEKLEEAIRVEQKSADAKEIVQRLSADDLNNMMRKARELKIDEPVYLDVDEKREVKN